MAFNSEIVPLTLLLRFATIIHTRYGGIAQLKHKIC